VYVTHDQIEAMTMGDRVAVLRRGVLQQFDVPQRLYERPANLFVASFIGSPAMNMLEGTLERQGDALICRIGAAALTLPAEVLAARPALAQQVGKPIAVGIRPEALDEPGRRDGGDGGRLSGRVKAVEALGPEQLVHVDVDAQPVLVEDVLEGLVEPEEAGDLAEIITDGSSVTVVARLDASASVRPDDPIELAVDLRHLHFFDLGSGEAIGA
jgi:multiple sugar transport system ATP-binding protein